MTTIVISSAHNGVTVVDDRTRKEACLTDAMHTSLIVAAQQALDQVTDGLEVGIIEIRAYPREEVWKWRRIEGHL